MVLTISSGIDTRFRPQIGGRKRIGLLTRAKRREYIGSNEDVPCVPTNAWSERPCLPLLRTQIYTGDRVGPPDCHRVRHNRGCLAVSDPR